MRALPKYVLMLCALLIAAHASAAARRETHIRPQSLGSALQALGQERGIQVLYRMDLMGSRQTAGLIGNFTCEEAVERLLRGTGLTFTYLNAEHSAIAISAAVPPPGPLSTVNSDSGAVNAYSDSADQETEPPTPGPQAPANGQTQAANPPGAIAEVVVTAEKRQSTVQETPISITAISGAELQARGLSSVLDVAQETPGVSMKTAGPGQTEFEMRGMSSTGGAAPTVGFYIDETPLTPPAFSYNGKVVIDPDLYDLNRIEVLRGPQGTLYGSGSMGGTIKLVTNPADPRNFAASASSFVSGTRGGGLNYGASGMVNIPINDYTAVRIVGTDKWVDGWIDRIVTGGANFPLPTNPCPGFYGCSRGNVLAAPVEQRIANVNWERLQTARVSVLFEPLDVLSVSGLVLYQRISLGGESAYDSPPDVVNAHFQPFNTPEPFRDAVWLYNLTAKIRLEYFDITSATSYWSREQKQEQDLSEVTQNFFFFPSFAAGPGAGPGAITEDDFTRQVSEEVRFTSNGDGKFKWLVGGFYERFNSKFTDYARVAGLIPFYGTDDQGSTDQPQSFRQTAVFGQLAYRILEPLEFSFGARWFSYAGDITTILGGITAPSTTGTYTASSSAADSGFNPRFNLSYTSDPNTTLYATAAKGFRPGAGNSPVPVTGSYSCLPYLQSLGREQAPPQFGPDSVWSYEIGEKLRFFDRRLTVNSAIYYEKWSDIQQSIPLGCGYIYTDNAGDAAIYGGELELVAELGAGWTLSQSAGYTHARISKASAEAASVVGQKLQSIPDITTSTSLAYRRPISDSLTFVGRISNSYVGPFVDVTWGVNRLPGYDLVDARAGIVGERFATYLYADNLTNTAAALTDAQSYSANMPTFNRITTNPPRTVGVSLEYHFK